MRKGKQQFDTILCWSLCHKNTDNYRRYTYRCIILVNGEGTVLSITRYVPKQIIKLTIWSVQSRHKNLYICNIWKHQSNLMGLELVVKRNLLDLTRTWIFINSDYKAVKRTDRRHQSHCWFHPLLTLNILGHSVTIWRHETMSALVQVMACRPHGILPSPKPLKINS